MWEVREEWREVRSGGKMRGGKEERSIGSWSKVDEGMEGKV